jgi:hypothetical protein
LKIPEQDLAEIRVERFKENLNNQLLNKLSNSLFEDQFGDKGMLKDPMFWEFSGYLPIKPRFSC